MSTISPPVTTRSALPVVLPTGGRLTFNGLLLFVIGLSVAASGFTSLRFEVRGLLMHPYLFVVGAVFPLFVVSRLLDFPQRILLALALFAALYFGSTFAGGVSVSLGVKIAASVVTIVTAALLVKSRADFLAGVLGLMMAMGFLAFYGLEADDVAPSAGYEAMEVANRNAYSLYALPVILMATFVLLQRRPDPILFKLVIATCMVGSVVMIIVSLNRSGWIGLALIGAMSLLTFRHRRMLTVAGICALAAAVYLIVDYVQSSQPVSVRFISTTEGTESDRLRWQLIRTSVELGLENPLFGTSPQLLPLMLGQRLGWASMEPHNVVAHLIGGCGFICFAALLFLGWTLWRWDPAGAAPPRVRTEFLEVRTLLRMMLVLWIVRGMFTHEILYSPGFCIGLGMCIGLCRASVSPDWFVTLKRSTRS